MAKKWFLPCAIGMAVISAVIWITVAASSHKSIWLSASQAKQMTAEPGYLSELEYQLIQRIPPLRRWRASRPCTIYLEGIIMAVSSNSPLATNLGQPFTANSNGARLWVIQPPDAPHFCTAFNADSQSTNSPYDWNSVACLCGPDPMSAFCSSRYYNNSGSYNEAHKHYAPLDDMEIHLTASAVSNSFALTVAMTMVQPTTNTNAPFGFRLRVPATGILVVDCGKFKDRFGRPYWFLLAPSDFRTKFHIN